MFYMFYLRIIRLGTFTTDSFPKQGCVVFSERQEPKYLLIGVYSELRTASLNNHRDRKYTPRRTVKAL